MLNGASFSSHSSAMLVGKTAWNRRAPGFATCANASPAHRDTS